MGYKLNIFSGQLDLSGGSSTPPVSTTDYHVDKLTLTPTDITNKFVALSQTPTTLSATRLVVIGGIEQDYSVDFTVSGSTLSWNGLALDGVLSSGDKLIVVYN